MFSRLTGVTKCANHVNTSKRSQESQLPWKCGHSATRVVCKPILCTVCDAMYMVHSAQCARSSAQCNGHTVHSVQNVAMWCKQVAVSKVLSGVREVHSVQCANPIPTSPHSSVLGRLMVRV